MKKKKRAFTIILVVLIILIATPLLLMESRLFQSRVASFAMEKLSGQLPVVLDMDSMAIVPSRMSVELFGLSATDSLSRPILYAHRINGNFRLLPLLVEKKLIFNNIHISGFRLHLAKETLSSPLNISQILGPSQSNTQTQSSLELDVRSLMIRNGIVTYDVMSEPHIETTDINHLAVTLNTVLSLKLATNQVLADSLLQKFQASVRMNKFSLEEQKGFTIEKLSLDAFVNDDSISLNNLTLKMPHSKVEVKPFSISARPDSSLIFNGTATLQARLSPSDFPTINQAFNKACQPLSPFDFNLSANGSTNRMNIYVKSSAADLFNIEGYCKAGNILSENRVITTNWQELRAESTIADIIALIIPSFAKPDFLDIIDYAAFEGNINLQQQQPSMDGKLTTGLGALILDCGFQKADSINYIKAHISSDSISVNNPQFSFITGPAAFKADIECALPQKDKLIDGKASIFIDRLSLLDYDYRDLSINASACNKVYTLSFLSSDSNCRLKLNVLHDNRYRNSKTTVKAEAPHVNLHKLNLLNSSDGKSDFSFNLGIEVSGNTLQQALSGSKVEISRLSLLNNGVKYDMDSMTIVSGKHGRNYYTQLASPVMTGRFIGSGTCLDMVKDIKSGIVDRYLPALSSDIKKWVPSEDMYQLSFNINETETLSKALGFPGFTDGQTSLVGSYDKESGLFRFDAKCSDIVFADKTLLSPNLAIDNLDDSAISCTIETGIKNDSIVSAISAKISARQDSISLCTLWNGFNLSNKGVFNALAVLNRFNAKSPLVTELFFNSPSLMLHKDEWSIEPSGIKINPQTHTSCDINLHTTDKYLTINGNISPEESDTLSFDIKGFRLDDIFDMLPTTAKKPFLMGGSLTARGKAVALTGAQQIEGTVSVDSMTINKHIVGNLMADSWWDDEKKCIRLDGRFDKCGKKDTEISIVKGKFTPAEKSLQLNLSNHGLPIDFVSYFIEPTLFLSGLVYGHTDVTVVFKDETQIYLSGNPIFQGHVKVDPTGGDYRIDDIIGLEPHRIIFNGVSLTDPIGHKGLLNGDLKHNSFHDIEFNMDIDLGESLQAMNLPFSNTASMYGNVLASGNVKLGGTGDDIRLDINARTENPSDFTLSLGTTSISDYDYIHFINKKDEKFQSQHEKINITPTVEKNTLLSINLQIDVTDDAEINLLISPDIGDGLKGRGNGIMHIEYTNNGTLGISGDYEFRNGQFSFNYGNLIIKNFNIEQGSDMRFSGDLLGAQLGITTSYHVPAANISNILSEKEQSSLNLTRSSIPVDCKLFLSGELQQPEIHMGLDFPNADTEVKRSIESVINTDEEINRQVIYLLLLNSFAPTNRSATGNTASSGMNAVFGATLSNLTSQLNEVISDIIGADNFSLGFNYMGDQNTGSNEWQVAMSGQLFDNRLMIDGNVGQRNNLVTDATNQFIGDFDLEYKLSQHLRLKAYSHSNDSRYFKSASTTQGLGIVVKDSFSTLKQLFYTWKESFRRQILKSKTYSDLLPRKVAGNENNGEDEITE